MKTRASAESLAMLLAFITLWWAASHAQWVSKVFLPTPEATWASLVEGLQQGDLFVALRGDTFDGARYPPRP